MREGLKKLIVNYSFVVKNGSMDYLAHRKNSSQANTIVIINCVLNAPLMLIAIIGNSLVLAAILRTPSLRSPSTVFLCSLAVSDLLVGLFIQPVFIVRVMEIRGYHLDAYNISSALACGVSLCTMAIISVDRFLALRYHMRYPVLMNTKRATHISAPVWFICPVLSCSYFLSQTLLFLVIAVCVIVCLLISTFSYVRIYRIVRQHLLQIQAQQQAVESLNAEHMMRSKKSAANTFIDYMCMILCYTPVFIASFFYFLFHKEWITVWALTNTLVFLNSSINPFLYCWSLSEVRAAVLNTPRNMVYKQTEES